MHTTLTSKGQVTIPKAVRDRLGLEAGDKLRFHFQSDGKVVVEPERSGPLGRLPGMLREFAPSTAVSIEEMHEGIRRRARGKHLKRRGA